VSTDGKIAEALKGKRVFVTGATGFLGKVFVSKLLHDAPEVAGIVVLIRKGKSPSAAARLEEEILRSPALTPVPESVRRAKLEALEGDTGALRMGLDEATFQALAARIDVVVHCAGVVDFSPPLDEAISVNVDGTIAAIALAKAAQAPLVHVSTCFVSGFLDGRVEERCEPGDHPDKERTGFTGFDAEHEVIACRAVIERTRLEAGDPSVVAAHIRDRGGDLAAAKKATVERAKARLRDEGKDRARRWGFPNSYTYSKGLAEQFVAAARERGEIRATVVRPAILESAMHYPFPGWNQGANTTAPLVYMIYRGQRFLPIKDGNFLDILPIDMCAGAMVAVTAAHVEGRAAKCYQLGSGDTNQVSTFRCMELSSLYYRRRPIPGWNPLVSLAARRFMETTAVSETFYRNTSLPMLAGAAKLIMKAVERLDGGASSESRGADDEVIRERRRGLARALKGLRRGASDTEKVLRKTSQVIDEFLPFIHGSRPVYDTRNTRALRASLGPVDRQVMLFEPESIDWRKYWHEVHLPGMEKWTFPELDRLANRGSKRPEKGAKAREKGTAQIAHANAHAHHASSQTLAAVTAMGGTRGGDESQPMTRPVEAAAAHAPSTHAGGETSKPRSGGPAPARAALLTDILAGVVARDGSHAMLENQTGKDVLARVRAGAARLRSRGVAAGDRVALVSENGPDWVVGYFAILWAGATAVPLDATLGAKDVAHLAALARAKGIYASAKRRRAFDGGVATEKLEELAARPAKGEPESSDAAPRLDPETPASLIFTSGTTGAPKGVLLPHRAFCSQAAALAELYRLGPDDRVLSVLPAHHAFEFTCGLVMPLYSGATIHFAGAATPDAVRSALTRVRPTAMIAVPALLEAFLRSIKREVRAKGDLAERAFRVAWEGNLRLRDNARTNLGKSLFKPAHEAFGGELRLLVSGGASLPSAAFEMFRGLGFDIFEGYGLTEAAPVVTTCRPGKTPHAGSVGEPIPGTEVRLARLRDDGTGEIEVKGPGLTLGYDGNAEATAALFTQDGWLKTGDLGRFDEDGTVAIVGRVKDVIVDASGNTVYPDEVEEAYAGVEGVSELAVARVATPEGREAVGALVVAKEGAEESAIEAGFRTVDATLPFPKRVRVLRFTSAALPRTATRKVKRDEVARTLAALLEGERQERPAPVRKESGDGVEQAARLKARRMVAEIAGVDPTRISEEARLAEDLGLDSLAQVELANAIAESTGRALPSDKPLEGVATVADVARLLAPEVRDRSELVKAEAAEAPKPRRHREPAAPPPLPVELPGFVKNAGNALLTYLQTKAYEGPLRAEVTGRSHIPQHTNALVVSNHASHLDVGLVKHALGDYGRHAASLGARDYFFSTPLRRLYFESFTEVVPFDRRDASREKLDTVVGRLMGGEPVIIFPEGTRASDGRLGEFRSGLGYLVLKARIGVLPVYLDGTHKALPKGAAVLRSRDLKAKIGRFLPFEELAEVAHGLGRHEAYRAIGAYVRGAMQRLQEGAPDLTPEQRGHAWRAVWDAEKQAQSASPAIEAKAEETDPVLDAPAESAPAPAKPHTPPETPEARAGRLLRSLPSRHKAGRISQAKVFYVKFGDGHDDRYTIRLAPERCEVLPGKTADAVDCVVRSTPEVLEKLIVDGDGPSFEDIAVGSFKTNDPDALRLLVEALGLGESAAR